MRPLMKNPVLILALAISGGAMALGIWSWQQWVKTTSTNSAKQWAVATVLPAGRVVPDVQLLDENAQAFSFTGLENNWRLLFFGFTHCPDICPGTLAFLATVNKALVAEQRKPIEMIFVSVDPQRDTPEKIRAYVQYFDADMRGVTGDMAALQKLTSGLYLPFAISEPDERGNYNVDHSGSLVLVNPQNQVRAYFSAPHQLEPVLKDLRKLIYP